MNKIFTILILVGMVLACKPKPEDIQPVEEITCRKSTHTYIDPKTNVVVSKSTYIYDETGKLIEVQSLKSTTKYEYDAKDNLLKTTSYSKNQGSETKTSETEYSYNTANQVIRQVTNVISDQMRTEKKSEYLYEYHANGKIKKWTWFDYIMVYDKPYIVAEYDENGNEILTRFYEGNYKKFEYNVVNLVVKETNYDPTNSPTYEYLHEYNSQNKKAKMSSFYKGVLQSYITYEYNSKGQQINSIGYESDGTVYEKIITEYTGENYTVSTYNDQNKLTIYYVYEVQNGLKMKASFYIDNKLVGYTVYAYDSHKNLIKLQDFSDAPVNYHQEWTYECN